jgi:hypothetical protein
MLFNRIRYESLSDVRATSILKESARMPEREKRKVRQFAN